MPLPVSLPGPRFYNHTVARGITRQVLHIGRSTQKKRGVICPFLGRGGDYTARIWASHAWGCRYSATVFAGCTFGYSAVRILGRGTTFGPKHLSGLVPRRKQMEHGPPRTRGEVISLRRIRVPSYPPSRARLTSGETHVRAWVASRVSIPATQSGMLREVPRLPVPREGKGSVRRVPGLGVVRV